MPRTNWNHSYLILKYPDVNTAEQGLAIISQMKKERLVTLKDAVVVYRTADGTTKMHQTVEPHLEQGAVLGVSLGLLAAMYIAMAPLALIITAGLLGGMGFNRIDRGIDNRALLRHANDLRDNSGLLCLLIKKAVWSEVKARLDPLKGEVVTYNLTPEAVEAFVTITKRGR